MHPQDCDASQLPQALQQMIPELDPTTGTHVVFSQPAERDRGESSCISVLALVGGRYELFTQPQADSVKLLESQWLELQQIISWIDPRFALETCFSCFLSGKYLLRPFRIQRDFSGNIRKHPWNPGMLHGVKLTEFHPVASWFNPMSPW